MLNYHLQTLEAAGLIQTSVQALEPVYLFRHALVQDAAYASLLRTDRASLHLAVGEVLETLALEETGEEKAAVLAQHFKNAGEEARALQYFRQAGDAASQRYAIAEAIEFYTQALQLAQSPQVPLETLRHLYGQRGRVLELSARYQAALADHEALEAAGQARNDLATVFDALIAQATLRSTFTPVYDEALSQQLTERALQLAATLGDPRAEVRAHWIRMHALAYRQTTPEALAHGERAIALARAHDFRMELAFALNDLSGNYAEINRFAEAKAMLVEASQLWRALGNRPMLADSLLSLARLYAQLGEEAAAMLALQEGYAISQAIGNAVGQVRALGSLAWASFEQGDINQMLVYYAQGEQVLRTYDLTPFAAFRHISLAHIYLYLGAYALCLSHAQQAQAIFAQFRQDGENLMIVKLLCARAQLAQGQLTEAKTILKEVEAQLPDLTPTNSEIARSWWLVWCELTLQQQQPQAVLDRVAPILAEAPLETSALASLSWWLLKGQAYMQQAQYALAQQAFTQALHFAQRKGRFWQWRPLILLHQAAQALGNAEAATAHEVEALAILKHILTHTPPDLRTTFCHQPELQPIVGALLAYLN